MEDKKLENLEEQKIKENMSEKENTKIEEIKKSEEEKKLKEENKVEEEIKNKKEQQKKYKKKKNIFSILFSIIEYLIIFILLVLIILVIYNKKTNKLDNLLMYRPYTIITGSMQPEINVGDIVIIKKQNTAEVGEIVAYQNNSSIIVHRVIEKVENNSKVEYITKGDNNNAPDMKTVKSEQIIGVGKYVIPELGHIAIFVATNPETAFGILVVLVLIGFLVYVIRQD